MTNPARNAETSRDVNLQRTRQAFLFAREQLAANRYASPYVPAGDARRRTPERVGGDHRAQDAPDWPMH
jgi:hypothetical protein